ncbi:MAG: hypothetical protein V1913_18510, partial [Fibrobacterota bacterium]
MAVRGLQIPSEMSSTAQYVQDNQGTPVNSSLAISSGNIGIGTTSPNSLLCVGSTDATAVISPGGANTHLSLAAMGANGSVILLAGGVANGTLSNREIMRADGTGGNVGIGTTSPAGKLDINGNTGTPYYAALLITDANVNHPMTVYAPSNGYGKVAPCSVTGGGLGLVGLQEEDDYAFWARGFLGVSSPTAPAVVLTAGKTNGSTGATALASTETVLKIQNYTTDLVTVKGGGNVGIGTTSPDSPLTLKAENTKPSGGSTGWWHAAIIDGRAAAAGVGGGIQFLGHKTAQTHLGFFGAIDGAKENGTSGDEKGILRFWTCVDAANGLIERMRITSEGNVGIGTTGPSRKLHISESSSSVLAASLRLENTYDGGRAGIEFQTDRPNGTNSNVGWIQGLFTGNNHQDNRIDISNLDSAGNATPVLSTLGSGNVGIGTTNPAKKLHVYGSSAGVGTTYQADALLVLESADSTGLNILAANDCYSRIDFGDKDDPDVAGITYAHLDNTMRLYVGTKSLILNSAGAFYLNDGTSSKQIGMRVFSTIAALKAQSGIYNGEIVQVSGYYSTADGGEGQFYWVANSDIEDNFGTIIDPSPEGNGRWKRIYEPGITHL